METPPFPLGNTSTNDYKCWIFYGYVGVDRRVGFLFGKDLGS